MSEEQQKHSYKHQTGKNNRNSVDDICKRLKFSRINVYFFGIVLYFYVYFVCVFSSILVAVWPFVAYLK